MSPHTVNKRAVQRIPLAIYDGDILLLMRLKHKLELDEKKPIQTNRIFTMALEELAKKHGIVEE